jgi:hypothetical protein
MEFFTDEDLLVSPGPALDDPSVVQLTLYLNRALQVVLTTTVDAEVLPSYQCEGLSGSALLAAIRIRFGNSTKWSKLLKVCKTITAQIFMTIDH